MQKLFFVAKTFLFLSQDVSVDEVMEINVFRRLTECRRVCTRGKSSDS